MSVRFYMDAHVPLAITEQLRMRDVDVFTAQTDNATRLEDSPLLDRATELEGQEVPVDFGIKLTGKAGPDRTWCAGRSHAGFAPRCGKKLLRRTC